MSEWEEQRSSDLSGEETAGSDRPVVPTAPMPPGGSMPPGGAQPTQVLPQIDWAPQAQDISVGGQGTGYGSSGVAQQPYSAPQTFQQPGAPPSYQAQEPLAQPSAQQPSFGQHPTYGPLQTPGGGYPAAAPSGPGGYPPAVPPAGGPGEGSGAGAPPPAPTVSVTSEPAPPTAGGVPGGTMSPSGYVPVQPDMPSTEAATFGGLVGVDTRKERPMLSVRDLEVFYGAARVLKGISFDVYQGEIVTIIGGNGAGKSTTLKTISGVSELLKSVRGKIWYKGRRIDQLPAHKIARLGIAHVPEGRRVFPESSVEDNLLLGAYRRFKRERRKVRAELDDIYDRFPVLAERRHRAAGLLSGGEQQMLAIARGLMSNPALLLLDEPSLGLAPILVREVFEIVNDLAAEGKSILIVEQMAVQALQVADRAYVLETGSITLEGTGQELIEDPRVKAAYLGGA
jgi:branched-chain amino acid transport system ATP-binding protein